MDTNLNQARQNKFSVAFSNFPGLEPNQVHSLYENYVHSLSIPSYTIEYTQSNFQGTTIQQPIARKNNDLEDLTISFKVDANFQNYFYANTFIQNVRYGANIPKQLNQYTINTISITNQDNNNNAQNVIQFTEAIIETLSEVELQFGVADPPVFSMSFKYRQILLGVPVI